MPSPTTINPDDFLETPKGRVWKPVRNEEAWRLSYAALEHAIERSALSCYPFLDHPAGRHPVPAGQGGPCAADRFPSDIGGLLPIALCGRTSL